MRKITVAERQKEIDERVEELVAMREKALITAAKCNEEITALGAESFDISMHMGYEEDDVIEVA